MPRYNYYPIGQGRYGIFDENWHLIGTMPAKGEVAQQAVSEKMPDEEAGERSYPKAQPVYPKAERANRPYDPAPGYPDWFMPTGEVMLRNFGLTQQLPFIAQSGGVAGGGVATGAQPGPMPGPLPFGYRSAQEGEIPVVSGQPSGGYVSPDVIGYPPSAPYANIPNFPAPPPAQPPTNNTGTPTGAPVFNPPFIPANIAQAEPVDGGVVVNPPTPLPFVPANIRQAQPPRTTYSPAAGYTPGTAGPVSVGPDAVYGTTVGPGDLGSLISAGAFGGGLFSGGAGVGSQGRLLLQTGGVPGMDNQQGFGFDPGIDISAKGAPMPAVVHQGELVLTPTQLQAISINPEFRHLLKPEQIAAIEGAGMVDENGGLLG